MSVGFFDAPQRDVFVAISGIWVYFLKLFEDNGFLRTVVYAGEAKLAIAFGLYAR